MIEFGVLVVDGSAHRAPITSIVRSRSALRTFLGAACGSVWKRLN